MNVASASLIQWDGLLHSDEAPQPQTLNAKGFLLYPMPKTDEERYQNLPLEQILGQKVDVTLKIDGQSFTGYYHRGEFGVGRRTLEFKLDSKNDYTAHIKSPKLMIALSSEYFIDSPPHLPVDRLREIVPSIA
jgi:hypothetical protein